MTILEDAAADAIRQTRRTARDELGALLQQVEQWREELLGGGVRRKGPFATVAEQFDARADAMLQTSRTRAKHLSHLHVVMFGRTGAGKSSFVEVLSRGDGRRVSPDGALDHTRKTASVTWRGIRVLDTPGVEGWAAKAERAKIEREARTAVERADLVVLVFDDYNQKAGEFRQIADWVSDLGKAAIAVLNVREPAWRYDARLRHPDDRTAIVQQVREHARRIESMLGRVGLPGTPVIAINLGWAFGARASDIRRHPHAVALEEGLSDVGADGLDTISNYAAVEAVLSELLTTSAETLRLGGVRGEQRSALASLAADLKEVHAAAKLGADQLATAVEAVLRRTGLPSRDEIQTLPEDARVELKALHDGLFGLFGDAHGPLKGEGKRRAVDHLAAPLAAARSRGLLAAQKLLTERAGERKSLAGPELQQTALDAARFKPAAQEALQAAYDEFAAELAADADDRSLEFAHEFSDLGATFNADAGQRKRQLGGAGGYASAIGAGVFIVSSPAGWTAGTVLAVGAIGGAVTSWGARKLRKSGVDERTQSRLRAEHELTKWLAETATAVQAEAERTLTREFWQLGARGLRDDVRAAALRRQLQARSDAVRKDVQRFARGIASDTPAAELVRAACAAVEETRFPGRQNAEELLRLGEDWLDAEAEAAEHADEPFTRPRLGDQIALIAPDGSAVEDFWQAAYDLGTSHEHIAKHIAAGRAILNDVPVVAFVGDYSAGKSSLIRRLTVALGLPEAAERLSVGAAPTTSKVVDIPAGDVVLRDTPGLNSEHPEHARRAQDGVAGAAVVVAVHTPVGGDLGAAAALLQTRDRRTIQVLARIDRLSARPDRDPEGFMRLLDVKRAEVRDHLTAIGLTVHPDAPLPVSADPGERHATSPTWDLADFLPFRGWDGIDDLVSVLRRESRACLPAAAIDRAISGLRTQADAIAEESAGEAKREHQLARLVQDFQRARKRHHRLEASAAADLRNLVEESIAERLEEIAELPAGRLEEIRDDAATWLVTPRLVAGFEDWREQTAASFTELYTELRKTTEARVESRAFQDAFKDADGDTLLAAIVEGIDEWVQGVGLGAAGKAGEAAVGLLAKLPALAPLLERFGAAAARGIGAVAGVALEGILQGAEAYGQREREKRLEEARNALRAAGDEWATGTLEGDDQAPGVLEGIVAFRDEIIDMPLADHEAHHAQSADRVRHLDETLLATQELIARGTDVIS